VVTEFAATGRLAAELQAGATRAAGRGRRISLIYGGKVKDLPPVSRLGQALRTDVESRTWRVEFPAAGALVCEESP